MLAEIRITRSDGALLTNSFVDVRSGFTEMKLSIPAIEGNLQFYGYKIMIFADSRPAPGKWRYEDGYLMEGDEVVFDAEGQLGLDTADLICRAVNEYKDRESKS